MATPGKGSGTKPAAKPQPPAKEETALVKTSPAPLAAVPEVDLAADAAQFQDEFDRSSLQIPFLQILQSNSPQCQPGHAKEVDGAKQSMLYNTVTKQLFDGVKKGVQVIPVYHYATIIEWRLREKGGGFIKDWGLVAGETMLPKTHKDEKKRDVLPNGETHLVRTEVYFIILVHENGRLEQMMLTMTSTQLKKARNWNSRMQDKTVDVPGKGPQRAPMFFNTYRLKTISESNAQGSWYGWVIEDDQPTLTLGKETYFAARAFREVMQKSVAAGTVNLSGAETAEGEGGTAEDAPF